jgi:hypothetical protein
MEFAQIKVVVCSEMPEGEAVVMSAEQAAKVQQAMSARMDVMLRAAIGAPLPPPEPTEFRWPPRKEPFDPYGIIAIRNVA